MTSVPLDISDPGEPLLSAYATARNFAVPLVARGIAETLFSVQAAPGVILTRKS
jgi:hypothetical protein